MRIVVQSFAQVLNSLFSKLVLSFAQYVFIPAPTKSTTAKNSYLSVLEVFKRLSFYPIHLFHKFSPKLFLSVKSLVANLVIKSHEDESL